MTSRTVNALLLRCAMLACLFAVAAVALAQDARLSFDVVSLRENTRGTGPGGDEPESNIPLGPGNVYSPTQGQLNLKNIDLMLMVSFAYRLSSAQQDALREMAPAWAREARYDMKARTEKMDVTKDELRLMMQSLLAERFGMKAHFQDRETSVYVLKAVKADGFGPGFRPHAGEACSRDFKGGGDSVAGAVAAPDGFPVICGGLLLLQGSTPRHFRMGARDMPVAVFANSLTSWGGLGRPVVNDTGVAGTVDFSMDFVPENVEAAGVDAEGDTFREALRKQLGLRLDAGKRAVPVLLLDAISKPTEN